MKLHNMNKFFKELKNEFMTPRVLENYTVEVLFVIGLIIIIFCFFQAEYFNRHRTNVDLKVQVIDIKVNNETHQYIQYRTSGFKHNFQLTHWEGCKYCQEKEKTLNKK